MKWLSPFFFCPILPWSQIKITFGGAVGLEKAALRNEKYFFPKLPPNVRERVSFISWTELSPFPLDFLPFGADKNCSGKQMFYWTASTGSLTYSIKSAGWQSRTSQILSNASTGRCLTAPVQIAETVGGLMPVFSANSFWVIPRIANITLTLNLIKQTTPFLPIIVSRKSYHFNSKSEK